MTTLSRFSRPPLVRWRQRLQEETAKSDLAIAQGLARQQARLNQALKSGDADAVERRRQEMERFLQASQAAAAISSQIAEALDPSSLPTSDEVAPPRPQAAVYAYSISSLILAQAHTYLTQHLPGSSQEPEWMLAVSGLNHDSVRTLEHLIGVRLASQSAAQASFDMQDFTRVAVCLYEHGQALHAIFHSHRFAGPPHPSATDDRLQRILEEGGYPAIQAVFSEDGYVRFFARNRRFVIEVQGKGVKPVDGDKNLYRIVQFGALSHPTFAASPSGRSDGLQSLPASSGR